MLMFMDKCYKNEFFKDEKLEALEGWKVKNIIIVI
jgi:hypothetical protein